MGITINVDKKASTNFGIAVGASMIIGIVVGALAAAILVKTFFVK